MTLQLPPLRERGADVLLLAATIWIAPVRDYGLPHQDTLAPDAEAALLAYPGRATCASWPT